MKEKENTAKNIFKKKTYNWVTDLFLGTVAVEPGEEHNANSSDQPTQLNNDIYYMYHYLYK